jgi:hypothetical protein
LTNRIELASYVPETDGRSKSWQAYEP